MTNLVKARAKELLGVEFALFSAEVARECQRCNVGWSIENPSTSGLWKFGPIAALAAFQNVRKVDWHMCQYGSPSKKPTTLMTNIPELDCLSRTCRIHELHDHVHTTLSGTVQVVDVDGSSRWVNRTLLAGSYPDDLCSEWASAIARWAPRCGFGGSISKDSKPRWWSDFQSQLRCCQPSQQRRYTQHTSELATDEAGTGTERSQAFLAQYPISFPRKGKGLDLGAASKVVSF